MRDKMRILAVDDDTDLLDVLKSTFQRDFEVVTARNGTEALRELPRSEPDLIIADIAMPKMNGLTLAKEVRQHPHFASTPIIFLTAINKEDRHISVTSGTLVE